MNDTHGIHRGSMPINQGRAKKITTNTAGILTLDSLTRDSLSSLFAGETAAICLPGHCPEMQVRTRLTEWLLRYTAKCTFKEIMEARKRHVYRSDSEKLPKEIYTSSSLKLQEYRRIYSSVTRRTISLPANKDQMRRITGNRDPGDQLVRMLQKAWQPGIRATEESHYNGRGIVLSPSEKANPHIDFHEGFNYRFMIAANVYLQMPDVGGELILAKYANIWDHLKSNLMELTDAVRTVGFRVSTIASAFHILRPNEGEAILFNGALVHWVNPHPAGLRVTEQMIIHYHGPAEPLEVQ